MSEVELKFETFEALVDYVVAEKGTANVPRDVMLHDIWPRLQELGKTLEDLNHEVMLRHAASKPHLQPGYLPALREFGRR